MAALIMSATPLHARRTVTRAQNSWRQAQAGAPQIMRHPKPA
jgi:hypothetical protein